MWSKRHCRIASKGLAVQEARTTGNTQGEKRTLSYHTEINTKVVSTKMFNINNINNIKNICIIQIYYTNNTCNIKKCSSL